MDKEERIRFLHNIKRVAHVMDMVTRTLTLLKEELDKAVSDLIGEDFDGTTHTS